MVPALCFERDGGALCKGTWSLTESKELNPLAGSLLNTVLDLARLGTLKMCRALFIVRELCSLRHVRLRAQRRPPKSGGTCWEVGNRRSFTQA